MRKKLRRIGLLCLVVAVVWTGGLLADRQRLREDILRLHVVGASDSREDQAVKLQVRDAILGSLEEGLADLTDLDQAIDYVNQMMPKLEQAANKTLAAAGFSDTVQISLTKEAFPTRDYDSFSLPAGIYNALRVVIGAGEGRNWWCVVFPQLCLGAAGEDAQAVANLEGSLPGTLTGQYEIRFWLLEQLGKLDNFFRDASEAG